MITKDQLVEAIYMTPQARELGDREYWSEVVGAVLPSVLNEVSMAHTFDFVMNTYSPTWAASTAEQTLTGANFDLLEIVSIRYSSPTQVLTKMRRFDALDLLDNGNTLGGVKIWYQSGIDNQGFPKITIADTPTSAATLTIDYRKKNVELSDWPDNFEWVIISGIMARQSNSNYMRFKADMKDMVRRYKAGGKDYSLAGLDPQILAANLQVNSNYRSN